MNPSLTLLLSPSSCLTGVPTPIKLMVGMMGQVEKQAL